MKVFIKNMVCQGTKHFVLLALEKLDIAYSRFGFNEIELKQELSRAEVRRLNHSLREIGLEARFSKGTW